MKSKNKKKTVKAEISFQNVSELKNKIQNNNFHTPALLSSVMHFNDLSFMAKAVAICSTAFSQIFSSFVTRSTYMPSLNFVV